MASTSKDLRLFWGIGLRVLVIAEVLKHERIRHTETANATEAQIIYFRP